VSRASVRDAVQATFTGTPGIASVYGRPPKLIDGRQQPAVVCHIAKMRERRSANQTKIRTYTIYLLLDFVSKKLKSEDGQDDFDALLEALETRLRANKTLGTAGSLSAAGEPTFESDMTMPTTQDSGSSYFAAALKFDVDEFIQGV
jgi:hypothetical protein